MAKQTARKIAAKGADQYMLRFPPGMRDAVAKLAESNGRSMNTEIVAAIEQHLKGPSRLDALEAFIEKHREDIEWIDQMAGDLDKLQAQVAAIDRGDRWDDD